MKDKPIVIIITLLGGAVAAVSCLINGATLEITLILVLVSLIAFLIIGIVAHKIYAKIKDEIESRMARDRIIKEHEEFEREKIENEKAIARANGADIPPDSGSEPYPEALFESQTEEASETSNTEEQ